MDEHNESKVSPEEFFRRLLEPLPDDYQTRFSVGAEVELARPQHLYPEFPVGVRGKVLGYEAPESAMASKGRVYVVRFDVTEHKIPYPDRMKEALRNGGFNVPDYYTTFTLSLGVNDLRPAATQ